MGINIKSLTSYSSCEVILTNGSTNITAMPITIDDVGNIIPSHTNYINCPVRDTHHVVLTMMNEKYIIYEGKSKIFISSLRRGESVIYSGKMEDVDLIVGPYNGYPNAAEIVIIPVSPLFHNIVDI